MYGSGGSHGGDGGAESESHDAPEGYGSFIAPVMFGSAGGNADGHKGLWLVAVMRRDCGKQIQLNEHIKRWTS